MWAHLRPHRRATLNAASSCLEKTAASSATATKVKLHRVQAPHWCQILYLFNVSHRSFVIPGAQCPHILKRSCQKPMWSTCTHFCRPPRNLTQQRKKDTNLYCRNEAIMRYVYRRLTVIVFLLCTFSLANLHAQANNGAG